MTRFLIIGTQRSGSTLLRRYLDSHPGIRCGGEIFVMRGGQPQVYDTWRRSTAKRRTGHWLGRKNQVYQYLDFFFSQSDAHIMGFKILYSHLRRLPYRYPMVMDYAQTGGFKIIHIQRRNALKTILSRTRAIRSRTFHSRSTVAEDKTTLPTVGLVSQLERMDAEHRLWCDRTRSFDTHNITYEDLSRDAQSVCTDVATFLGAAGDHTFSTELVKLTPDRLSDAIENYEQVHALLKDTRFAFMLDDN